MTPEQVRHGLAEMAKSHGPDHSLIAQVQSVNEQEGTCVLIDEDDQLIYEVRLTPVLDGQKSFFQRPKIGTYVLAVRVENGDDWYMVAASEVDKIILKTASAEVELAQKVSIKNEAFSLADLVQELFAALAKLEFASTQGASMGAANKLEFAALKNKFKQLLK